MPRRYTKFLKCVVLDRMLASFAGILQHWDVRCCIAKEKVCANSPFFLGGGGRRT